MHDEFKQAILMGILSGIIFYTILAIAVLVVNIFG